MQTFWGIDSRKVTNSCFFRRLWDVCRLRHIKLRPLRGGEGALNHGHMREVFGVGEGYGATPTMAAAGLAFDADAFEGWHPVFLSDAPHRADLPTLAAARAQLAVA